MLSSWKFWAVLGGIAVVVGLFAYGFTVDPNFVQSPLVGGPAPPFRVAGLDGRPPLSLNDLRGTPVVLNFWASWCVACRDEAAILQEAHLRYEKEANVLRVVGIAIQDTPEKAVAFAKRFGKTYYLGLDTPSGEASLAYGLYGVPETFLLAADGTVLDKRIGPVTRAGLAEWVARISGPDSE
ncbi:MAG: redoxin family protein [SAR324 cluster bacterium]|nr:redoxin family protein [SAR324 cluster bacterium]